MIEGSNVKLSSAHPTRTLRKSVQRFHTDLQVVFQQQAWTFFKFIYIGIFYVSVFGYILQHKNDLWLDKMALIEWLIDKENPM